MSLEKNYIRIEWIDIAKCLGIILVLVGHIKYKNSDVVYMVIKEFHMPLFFFLSGLTFKEPENLAIYTKKKLIALWIPFVLYNTLFVILHNILIKNGLYSGSSIYGLTEFFKAEINVMTFSTAEKWGGATWFLTALFEASVLLAMAFFLSRKLKKYRDATVISLCTLFFIVGYYTNLKRDISVALVATLFMCIGFYTKKICNNLRVSLKHLMGVTVSIVLLIVISPYNSVIMVSNSYSNPILLLVGAVIGIYIIVIFSKYIERFQHKNIFLVIGKNTLTILSLHFVFYTLVNCINVWYYKLSYKECAAFPTIVNKSILGVIIYFAVSLGATVLVGTIIRRVKNFILIKMNY